MINERIVEWAKALDKKDLQSRFGDYLVQQGMSLSVVNTNKSDAFYIYRIDEELFWNCIIADDYMERMKAAYYQLLQEKQIDHQSGTHGSYFTAFQRFHDFLIYCSENEGGKKMNIEKSEEMHDFFQTKIPLNTILYGPPGTGKTYNTVVDAMKIVCPERYKQFEEKKIEYEQLLLKFENLRFDTKKNTGQIGFITFHQSYSYEDFIEGIRPEFNEEDSEAGNESCKEVRYRIRSGIFKAICDKASQSFFNKEIGNSTFANLINGNPVVWKVSLKGTLDNEVRTDCLEHGYVRIGYDEYGENVDFNVIDKGARELNAFINTMQIGDIVLSCYTSKTIDAIGVVEGDYEWHEEYSDYKRLRKVRWVYKGKKDIVDINDGKTMTLSTVYKLKTIDISDVAKIVNEQGQQIVVEKNDKPYVLIIDEINRGNISKIFGELITLIEDDKREKLKVTLPYSQEEFTVPKNLYIIGTMNTADRSIAALDIALRRRFTFVEMMPKADLIENIELREKFEELNKRITILLDRDHQIGHSYFMNVKTMEELKNVWFNKIIPLINEYFYGDWEKMKLVIPGFIKEENVSEELKEYCDTEKIYSFKDKDECDFKDLFGKMYGKEVQKIDNSSGANESGH